MPVKKGDPMIVKTMKEAPGDIATSPRIFAFNLTESAPEKLSTNHK